MPSTLEDGMVLTVEVGFSTSAGSGTVPINSTLASITWTDITQYVRDVSTTRGRSSELDTYSAGSCSVILDNRTRLFDPENTSGTYYGKLTPFRPIRIRVTPSGGTIRSIFFGFIDQWPQAYSYPRDATVTVTASDAFKVLNQYKLPSYWNTTITAAAPTAWYPLSDPTGSTNAFEVMKQTTASALWQSSTANVSSTATTGSSLLAIEPTLSTLFDSQKILQITDPLNTDGSVTTFSVEMWIQTTETITGNYSIWNHGTFVNAANIGMVVASGNATIVGQFGGRSGGSSYGGTINIQKTVNDGKPHHILLMYDNQYPSGPKNYALYVDGSSTATAGSYLADVDNQYSWMTLGYPVTKTTDSGGAFDKYFVGSIQHLVVYKAYAATAADALAHYQIGAGTYLSGNRTDQRITTLSALAGWMSDGLDLGTGDTTVLGINITGKGLLDALKEVETAEQGRLFMSVDGKIKFVDRNSEGSGNFITSQATFSDKATGAEIAYSDITLTYDDRYIFNDITFAQPDGTSYNSADTTSQGKYFKQSFKVENFIADSGYFLVNASLYKLAQYKDPQMRIDELTVNTRRKTAYQSPCTTLDIGDRITVNRTPQNVGSAISKTLIIEGIKHHITRDKWTVTFNTSPTLQNAPFVLDSATLGVLGTNILGY